MVFPWMPEVVIFLNIFISLGSFHGNWLFLPMPPFKVLAKTRSNGIWRVFILILNQRSYYKLNASFFLSWSNLIQNNFPQFFLSPPKGKIRTLSSLSCKIYFNLFFLIYIDRYAGRELETRVRDTQKAHLSALLWRECQLYVQTLLHLGTRNHQERQWKTSRHGRPLRS